MSTPERHERVSQLFAATCELSEAERKAVLDQECGEDPALRSEVEALLAEDAGSRSFMETPALGRDFHVEVGVAPSGPRGDRVGERIGHYVLVMKRNFVLRDRLLGEGERPVHVGVHGGTTPAEMLVPLVMADT